MLNQDHITNSSKCSFQSLFSLSKQKTEKNETTPGLNRRPGVNGCTSQRQYKTGSFETFNKFKKLNYNLTKLQSHGPGHQGGFGPEGSRSENLNGLDYMKSLETQTTQRNQNKYLGQKRAQAPPALDHINKSGVGELYDPIIQNPRQNLDLYNSNLPDGSLQPPKRRQLKIQSILPNELSIQSETPYPLQSETEDDTFKVETSEVLQILEDHMDEHLSTQQHLDHQIPSPYPNEPAPPNNSLNSSFSLEDESHNEPETSRSPLQTFISGAHTRIFKQENIPLFIIGALAYSVLRIGQVLGQNLPMFSVNSQIMMANFFLLAKRYFQFLAKPQYLFLIVLGSTELISRIYFPDWNRDCHKMIRSMFEKLRNQLSELENSKGQTEPSFEGRVNSDSNNQMKSNNAPKMREQVHKNEPGQVAELFKNLAHKAHHAWGNQLQQVRQEQILQRNYQFPGPEGPTYQQTSTRNQFLPPLYQNQKQNKDNQNGTEQQFKNDQIQFFKNPESFEIVDQWKDTLIHCKLDGPDINYDTNGSQTV